MTILPVVAREMMVQSRQKNTYRTRGGAAFVALGVMFWLMLVSSANLSAAEQGQGIFTTLASLSFLFTLFAGAAITADCLSVERREGTLGLLFLTDLRPQALVLGKVAASSLLAISALIGILPVLALGFLLGGVTANAMMQMAAVLLNTLFLSLAVGAFVSGRSLNERRSMLGTVVILLLLTGVPFSSGFLVGSYDNPAFVPEVFCLSPAYSFFATQAAGPRPIAPTYVWEGLALQHALGWLFLVGAGRGLKASLDSRKSRWRERLDAFAEAHLFGAARERKEHRARLLDKNAFLWLGAREKVKPRYAWGIVFFFMLLWGGTWWFFQEMALDLPVLIFIMVLAHFVFKTWTCSEICNRFIQDRRAGALELLLTTPMDVPEIAHGISLALRHIFFRPIAALLAFEVFLFFAAYNAPRQLAPRQSVGFCFVAIISTFLVDLWALKWAALWSSLHARSMERVLLETLGKVLSIPFGLFLGVVGGLTWMLQGRSSDLTPTAVFQLWLLINLPYALIIGTMAKGNFLKHFRESAAAGGGSAGAKPGNASVWLRDRLGASNPLLRRLRWMPEPLRRHWVLTTTGATALLLLAVALVRSAYWERQVDRQLAAIAQRKEPITVLDIDRFYPRPNTSQDASPVLMRSRPTLRMSSRAFSEFKQNPGAEEIASWERAVQTNRLALAGFHEAARMEKLYLPPPVVGRTPNFWGVDMNAFGLLARAEILLAIERGDTATAERGLSSLLRFIHLTRRVPLQQAQALCVGLIEHLLATLEPALARLPFTEATLAALQALAREADDPSVLGRSLAFGRCILDHELRSMLNMPWMPTPVRTTGAVADGFRALTGAKAKHRAEFLEAAGRMVEAGHLPPPERYQRGDEASQHMSRVPRSPWAWAFGSSDAMANLSHYDGTISASLIVVETALALRRYELRDGAHPGFPETLEQLVPEFMPAAPKDPFVGLALRYFRDENGATVYSVGRDQADHRAVRTHPGQPLMNLDLSFQLRPAPRKETAPRE